MKANQWYTSDDVQETKKLLDNGCPQLEEEINYKAMGLKQFLQSLMPLGYHPHMDDCNHANQLCTISPSVPCANQKLPVPPLSPNMS